MKTIECVRRMLVVAILLGMGGCGPVPPRLATVALADADPGSVLFRDVAVFDGERLLGPRDVLIRGERIEAVAGAGTLEAPGQALVVDGAGRTLLPGLIDSHAHLFSAGERRGPPPSPAAIASAFLFSGVTTVLVAAGGPEVGEVSAKGRSGEIVAPHLITAGPGLTAPGGHPIPLLRATVSWPMRWLMIRSIPVAEDAGQAAKRVAEVVEEWQPDLLKIIFDDLPPGSPHLSTAALEGAIAAARLAGVRPVVHASASADAVTAAEAGAALLMHVPQKEQLTEEQIERLRAVGVPVVSTARLISASRELAARGPSELELAAIDRRVLDAWIDDPTWDLAGFSEEVDRRNAEIAGFTEDNVRSLLSAGVPILAGTDSGVHGVFPGVSLHAELAKLVELGMTPIEALRSATSLPAEFLDHDARFGRVAPGYRADLLLVRGDPSVSIEALAEIEDVFLAGRRLVRVALGARGQPPAPAATSG